MGCGGGVTRWGLPSQGARSENDGSDGESKDGQVEGRRAEGSNCFDVSHNHYYASSQYILARELVSKREVSKTFCCAVCFDYEGHQRDRLFVLPMTAWQDNAE